MGRKETVLVTGATGFVGTNLVNQLSERDYEIVISGRSELDDPRYFRADITEKDEVAKIFDGVNYVIHLAAYPLGASGEDPEKGLKVNMNGTLNILEECIKHNVKKIVFTSSASVYGESEKKRVSEDQLCFPKDIYSIAKLASEGLLRTYYEEHGLKYTAFRLFNVYGPHQNVSGGGLIPTVMERIVRGEEIVIRGDGRNGRDFIFIDDVVNMITEALDAEDLVGVYNLGFGDLVSISRVVEIIASVFGRKALIRHESISEPDIRSYCADMTKLGGRWESIPGTGFREGIERTKKWYCQRCER